VVFVILRGNCYWSVGYSRRLITMGCPVCYLTFEEGYTVLKVRRVV